MSKARSPRDVCSTTMGTRGLMVLGSSRGSGGFLPETLATALRPPDGSRRLRAALELACPNVHRRRRRRLLPARRPELAAHLRLPFGQRVDVLDHEFDGAALRDVVAQLVDAPGLLELTAQLLGCRALLHRRRLQRLEDLAV